MSKSDKVKAKKEEVEKRDEDSSDEEERDAEGQEGSDDEEHEEEGADKGGSDESDSDDDSDEADDEESDDEESEGEAEGDESAEDEPADEDSEEDDEDEEEAAAPAAGEFAAKYSAKKVRARRPHTDDHTDEPPPDPEDEDPFWWGPHAVLGFLIVFGVLGFFGIFNRPLAFLRPANMKAAASAGAETPATPPPQPQTQQPTPLRPPALPDQPQREMFGAKHLLVMYVGGRRAPPDIKRTKDEAKARATEAMKKAKNGKSKFEDVVKEYTDEPGGGARGGDLGTFPKGSMVPEFQAGLEKLKVGEISDVVESPFGYHVILRTK